MLTQAQQDRRRQGIGASEVGAILGLNRYKTALDVYLDKLGLTPPSEDSEAAEWGHRLEPVIAEKYAARHPEVSLQESDTVAHPEHSWALATPDRVVLGGKKRKLVEIKTREDRTAGEFGEPGTDQVPDEVLVQCQWQLFVTGAEEVDVALLVNGRRFSIYTIPADPELQQHTFDIVEGFWTRHVLAQVPPDVTAQDNKSIALLFPKDAAPMVEGTPEAFALAQAVQAAKDLVKAQEQCIDEAEAKLKLTIGANAGLSFPGGSKVTWRAAKDSEVVDWKAIVAALNVPPEVIAQHTTTRPGSRRFLVSLKEAK